MRKSFFFHQEIVSQNTYFCSKITYMRDPLIKYAYDGETGEIYDSDILFETAKKKNF